MSKRRTQAERREATQASLLSAARRLFGERGYADTSLDDIAAECDLTVRPIYHYFENKLGLFKAVTEDLERESVAKIQNHAAPTTADIWAGFMRNCEDPHYRQILLVDAPALLGRSRMTEGAISLAAREESAKVIGVNPDGITMSLLFGALSSAALYIAENGASPQDYERIRSLIEFHSQTSS
ncbi:MAG: TetR/AcrR family transcriptional regulator [Maricaulaceae bacterium]